MLEKILEHERTLFLLLNSFHSPSGDKFMYLFSGFTAWIPVSFLFFVILFYTNRTRWKEILLIVAAIAVTITLCDKFASGICKPYFARFRPTHHPDFMNDVITVFGYRGGRYGFISSHAANGFGFAMITSLIFRNRFYTVLLMLWATCSSYSRIYLGVHFISDIIPGILAGLFFGWLVYKLFVLVHKKLFAHGLQIRASEINGVTLISLLLLSTVVILIIISLL